MITKKWNSQHWNNIGILSILSGATSLITNPGMIMLTLGLFSAGTLMLPISKAPNWMKTIGVLGSLILNAIIVIHNYNQ